MANIKSSNHFTRAVRTTKPALKIRNVKINTRALSSGVFLIVFICLIIGASFGGIGTYILTRNDCFEIVQSSNQVDMVIGGDGNPSTYEELGVKCVAFGQDATSSVKIKYLYREDITHDTQAVDEIDVNVGGIYYVVYTSTNLKYRTVQLIRNVVVVRAED